jgi:hypothetical protein
MTGTGTWTSASPNNHKVYDITVGTSGLRTVAGSPYIYGLLTVNSNGIGGGGGITIGLSGPTAPVMNGGATFVNIGQVIYQCGTTCYAAGTDYNTIRISAGSDVILTGDIGDAHQVKLDGGTTFTTNGYDITTNVVNHTGDNIFVTGGSELKFDHTYATPGFGTSYGDLNAEGFAGAAFENVGSGSQYLDSGASHYTGASEITVSGWYQFVDGGTYNTPISGDQYVNLWGINGTGDGGLSVIGNSFLLLANGGCFRYFSNSTPTPMADVLDGEWHHIVAYGDWNDSSTYRLFIDGVEQTGGGPVNNNDPPGDCSFVDASSHGGNTIIGSGGYGTFKGGIADVRFFTGDKTGDVATLGAINPAISEGNVYPDPSNALGADHWYKLNETDDFAAGGADSAGSDDLTKTGNVKSGNVLITSTSATPSNYWVMPNTMAIVANHATFNGHKKGNANSTVDIVNTTFSNNISTDWCLVFGGSTNVVRFNHNTFSHTGGGYGFETTKAYAGYDNIVFTGTWSTWHVRSQNVISEFTNSNFDLAKVDLQTSGNLVSRNHNDVLGSYHVLAKTLEQSDITNKVVPADTNLYLETGTWELDENANFQTATLTITSGTLEVTADNTWGTVTPANVNSYPEVGAGAVLYWWNAVFNPMAITRHEDAGLIAGNINGTVNYEIYGKADYGDASVGYTPTSANAVILRAPDCSLPFLQYCTVYTIDNGDIIQMLNLTIYNHSKWHQQQGSISEYHPGSTGAYIFIGGLWSIQGDVGDLAEARRLSSLPNGIWNLTPQGCRVDSLHVGLANIRHEFEPCGMIPYFASTGSDNWPGNDTVWFDGLISVTNGVQINTPSGIILGNPEATTFNISVIVLSNITQPENLSVDFWFKRMDNPDTVVDECGIDKAIEQGYLCNVWTMIVMDNHLDGNYSLEFSHWYPGEYEYFFEANDTKNDITDKFTFKFVKPPGPFDKFMALIPSVVIIALFSVVIPLIGRFARLPL